MTNQKRLTLEEREKIYVLVNQGKSNREISAELNRSLTTISRELRRCGTKFEYSPSKAETKARGKAPLRRRKKLIDVRPEVFDEVIKRLNLRNSPEQISESIKKESPDDQKNGYLMNRYTSTSMHFLEAN